jgi:hypothetical protein
VRREEPREDGGDDGPRLPRRDLLVHRPGRVARGVPGSDGVLPHAAQQLERLAPAPVGGLEDVRAFRRRGWP